MKNTVAVALFACWLILASVTGACASPLQAPGSSSGKVEALRKQATLDEALGALASKAKYNILADSGSSRKLADVEFSGTLTEALNLLAETFDTSWTETKSGVILMTKRYRDESQRPHIHVPELRQSVREALRILDGFSFPREENVSTPETIMALARSLNPAQIQMLLQGARLRIGDLPPPQRSLAEQAIYNNLFAEPYRSLKRLLDQLTFLETSYLHHQEYTIYTSPTESGKERRFTHVSRDRQGRNIYTTLEERAATLTQKALEETEKPRGVQGAASPDALARAATMTASGLSDGEKLARKVSLMLGSVTLEEIAAGLSQQIGLEIAAAETLRKRKITVFCNDLTARAMLNALAALHGWAWYKADTGKYLLTRRSRLPARDIREVARALQSVLPLDFQRYISVEPPARPGEARPNIRHPAVFQAGLTAQNIRDKLERRRKKEQAELFASLQADLLAGRKIPYRTLSARQQESLVFSLILQALAPTFAAGLLRGELRPYHRDPANAVLEYKQHPNGSTLKIYYYWQEEGVNLSGGFGVGLTLPLPQ